MSKPKNMPIIGSHFDCGRMNLSDRFRAYADQLEFYRPRGFSGLATRLRVTANRLDRDTTGADFLDDGVDLMDAADEMLTAWAQRVERHGFIYFGPFENSGDVGFQIATDNAIEEADIQLDAGETVPRGFSGMAVFVNDHGNVFAFSYSRGRKTRTLFDVV